MNSELSKTSSKGIQYEPVDRLLKKKIEKLPDDISSAMKEYTSSKLFSPSLEQKKIENLNNFFIVTTN